MQTEQERFEGWALHRYLLGKTDECYNDAETHSIWVGWQARAALESKPLAEKDTWKECCKNGLAKMTDNYRDNSYGKWTCRTCGRNHKGSSSIINQHQPLESKPVKSCETCANNFGGSCLGYPWECIDYDGWKPIPKPETTIDRLNGGCLPTTSVEKKIIDAILELDSRLREAGK